MTARPVLESRQHLSTWGWASPDPPRAGSRARGGTGAGAAPPGQLGTALGTQECGTGSRSTGCASAGPSGAPPAPADPTGRGREPSRDCCPPAMFPRLMCASQRHSPEPAGKALRCDTLRRPPSSLLSLRPAPKECAGPVPTAVPGQRARRAPAKATCPRGHQPVPRELRPHPQPGHSPRSPRGHGPAERLLGTRHHRGGARHNGKCGTSRRGLRTSPVSAETAP